MKLALITEDNRRKMMVMARQRAKSDGYLYHVSEAENANSIMQQGLLPSDSTKSKRIMTGEDYSPRIFLALSVLDADSFANLLYEFDGLPSGTELALFKIDPRGVNGTHPDPHNDGGVYTEHPIDPSAVSVVEDHQWFEFWVGDDDPYLNGTWRESAA